METLLNINSLTVTFKTDEHFIPAVRGVNLTIAHGEKVAIVGESGAGKSQIFHAVMGIQAGNANLQGSAVFNGIELINASDKVLNKFRGSQITMIFQDPMTALNPYLKVGTQLTEVLQVHKTMPYLEARDYALNALTEVKIPDPSRCLKQYPHELSGGMRQRIMIAMALLCKPKLIIADEPTTALDVTVQSDIIYLLNEATEVHRSSLVLITHDIPLVAGICDRVIIMYAGRIVESGSIKDIHASALHPYTQALLAATPQLEVSGQKLLPIPGQPPNPAELGNGCSFYPRCKKADTSCNEAEPVLQQASPTQAVACHRWVDQQ